MPYLYSEWALFVLRLVLGLIFFAHGSPKIKNLKSAAQNFEAMGFKPGSFWGPLVAVVETFGGLALLLGFGARTAASVLAIQFLVINVWKMSRKEPFVGGFEFDLLIFASLLAVWALGPGVFALGPALLGL